MNKLCRNYNRTLCHPEEKPKNLSRFFTTLRMTVSPLSSSDLSLPRLSSLGLTAAVLACLLLTLPTQAKWGDNCTLNGGTIIKANEYGNDKGGYCNDPNNADLTNNCNGMEFCVSNKTMNWWSAFTWCDSIGGTLISLAHACPGTQAVHNLNANACPNLRLALTSMYWSWTSTAIYSDQAFSLSNGSVATDAKRTKIDRLALCEE